RAQARRPQGELRQPAAAQGTAGEHRQDHSAVVSIGSATKHATRTRSERPHAEEHRSAPTDQSSISFHSLRCVSKHGAAPILRAARPSRPSLCTDRTMRAPQDEGGDSEAMMIITSVEFEPCVMPLEDKNWTFALGTASTSRGYVVRLTSDSGHV